jgi:uncharacterized protein
MLPPYPHGGPEGRRPDDETPHWLISDTHGLLRPAAIAAFQGVERIIHAGDIDTPGVLQALRALAPVTAVRGNVDRGPGASDLPTTAALTIDQVGIYVLTAQSILAAVLGCESLESACAT